MYGEFFVAKLGKTKIWGRSYTTIPFAVRSILHVENGDEVEWVLKNNIISVKKINTLKDIKDEKVS